MSKDKIVDAAIKLFSELGYHRTSMDDIAKEANVAKGTLYYHFTGKGELFEVIVTSGMHMLREKVDQALTEDSDPDQLIRTIVSKHIELFSQYSELVHIIFNEMTNGIEPPILERINKLKQEYINFLSGVLTFGYTDGALKKFNSDIAAAGLLGMLESACMYVVSSNGKYTIDDLHETVNELILPALLRN
ncbi:TetR/AcrR family transcriptional regulator [Paenibacillus yanchengensis]|uniref:TetR/AcrR family transcriptional regulator n=1 Tax=Paenibacillus yanchengensis TaxID=2035833 RepID=A0ABW4YI14_9BACL